MSDARGARTAVTTATLARSTIRENATKFAHAFRHASRENAERQLFWIRFFEVFGVASEQVATFELLAERASTGRHGWIDLLYPGQMGVEHKSLGEDLDDAMGQLLDYYTSLSAAEQPWLLIACDFQTFKWHNLRTGHHDQFSLAELPDNLDLFWWIAGYGLPEQRFDNEEEANLAATELLKVIHDRLSANGYGGHPIREWLTRVLFCLFADDTGVWGRAAFHAHVAAHSRPDGSDLGATIETIFQILNTPPERRPQHLDEDLAQFVYVNGDLFEERLPIPFCDAATREALLEACRFEWSIISPAIFGSLFQNVTTAADRRQLGAHYTTEENILRTVRPLFLDEMEGNLEAATTKPKLRSFLDHLPGLTFFDPACGCGNFLVIAYRELRRLETEALRRLHAMEEGDRRRRGGRRSGQLSIDVTLELQVRVDQFYGIEIEEFPAKIARTALYLADHLANRQVSVEFGQHYVRFPIPAAPHITIGNALRMDWSEVLPSEEADYVLGNPPFVGMSHMEPHQQEDNRRVFVQRTGLRTGRLDYVACWYVKAVEYVGKRPTRLAFVSTNSITQGEQARSLGPLLKLHGYQIDFAHRTFAWTSEARGKAHVHVVIIGFSHSGQAPAKRLFDYPDIIGPPIEKSASNINWYLADAPDVVIAKHTRPFVAIPPMTEGNRPEDGGGLLLTEAEAAEVRATDPRAAQYIRPLVCAREWLSGIPRFCLWLEDADPRDVANSPLLQRRLSAVRAVRLAAKGNTSSENRRRTLDRLAAKPGLFVGIRQPKSRYLCAPAHSSENRRVVPMWFCDPHEIAHNSTQTVASAPLWLFGVMQSGMYAAWLRSVAGRLKSDIRIAPDLAYNAFPFPDPPVGVAFHRLDAAAQAVLDERAKHPDSSLAVLYGPLSMPGGLSEAHDRLDRVVDSLMAPRRRPVTDADRLAILFERYSELVDAGRMRIEQEQPTRRRRRARGAGPSGASM